MFFLSVKNYNEQIINNNRLTETSTTNHQFKKHGICKMPSHLKVSFFG